MKRKPTPGVFIMMGMIGGLTILQCKAPPVGPLPDNSLYHLNSTFTNDAGRSVTLSEYRGRKVLLAMIYTNCVYICPRIVADMKRIEDRLRRDGVSAAHFVAVSFDPERDTPAALRLYRRRMKLDESWSLLSGSPDDVRELSAALGVAYTRLETGDFSHSIVISVLDENGVIIHRQEGNTGDTDEILTAIR